VAAPRDRKCCACEERLAVCVAHHDEVAPANPALFCQACFDALHLDAHGNKLQPGLVVHPLVAD
jgi:hypothetical protein